MVRGLTLHSCFWEEAREARESAVGGCASLLVWSSNRPVGGIEGGREAESEVLIVAIGIN